MTAHSMALRIDVHEGAMPADYGLFVDSCATSLVQQSAEWCRVISHDVRDTLVTFVARDRGGAIVGVLAACHYRGMYGDLLISAPQAGSYGGVVVQPGAHARSVERALLERFVAESTARGCLLATVSTPPFHGDDALYRDALMPDFSRANFYQYIDLSATPLDDDARRAAKYEKRARAAQVKHGFVVRFGAEALYYEAWLALHEARMSAIGAASLPRWYLEAIRTEVLAAGKGTLAVIERDGRLLAGCLFVGQQQVLDVFSLVGTEEGDATLATSVLVVESLAWARTRGVRWFNWQSCSSRESGVYHFKAKWGSQVADHHYFTRITGDIAALRHVPLDEVRATYPWHYVMPFEQFVSPVSLCQS